MGKGTSEVTVLGRDGCAITHDVVDYLTRNHVFYRWLNVDQDQASCAELGVTQWVDQAPLVKVGDQWSIRPSLQELAELLGTPTSPSRGSYDLAIIGAGPAGLAGAVVAASEGLSVCLIEALAPGGQASRSHRIENYLGFPDGLSGPELGHQGRLQAERLGAEFVQGQVWAIKQRDQSLDVYLGNDNKVTATTVLVATGQQVGKLEAPGADDLVGSGVYYGAPMTEVRACRDQHVILVGGGNSAGQGALCLAEHAREVSVVIRSSKLSDHMSDYLVKRLEAHPKVTVHNRATIRQVTQVGSAVEVTLSRPAAPRSVTLRAQGLFVFIGQRPNTTMLPAEVRLDPDGYVLSGEQAGAELPNQTSLPNLFVAGDLRSGNQQRIATAASDGAVAVNSIRQYLRGERW